MKDWLSCPSVSLHLRMRNQASVRDCQTVNSLHLFLLRVPSPRYHTILALQYGSNISHSKNLPSYESLILSPVGKESLKSQSVSPPLMP